MGENLFFAPLNAQVWLPQVDLKCIRRDEQSFRIFPIKLTRASIMTPKARHMRNSPYDKSISVEKLFAAAFNKSHFIYQRESLLGWRPVINDLAPGITVDELQPPTEKTASFTNSPDIKVRETSVAILIEVLLPKINEDSLYLEISGDLLIIKAQSADTDDMDTPSGDDVDHTMVHRYVKLPITAQPGNVQARIEDNLLRVIINKPWTGIKEE
jgi:HSP20 family molecular chaperone IbpA